MSEFKPIKSPSFPLLIPCTIPCSYLKIPHRRLPCTYLSHGPSVGSKMLDEWPFLHSKIQCVSLSFFRASQSFHSDPSSKSESAWSWTFIFFVELDSMICTESLSLSHACSMSWSNIFAADSPCCSGSPARIPKLLMINFLKEPVTTIQLIRPQSLKLMSSYFFSSLFHTFSAGSFSLWSCWYAHQSVWICWLKPF